jgi:hypothetical protein
MPRLVRSTRPRGPSESDLTAPVQAWLERQGLKVHCEVPLAAKKVDVVGMPRKADDDKQWIGVELKLSKWRAALAQAAANTIAFDRSYVALWHESTAPALAARDAFERSGVGLISVGPCRVKVLIPAAAQRRLGQLATKRVVRSTLAAR